MRATAVVTVAFAALAASVLGASNAGALDSAFTYQGRLEKSGTPADGQCDFEFRLFDAASGGAQIGSTIVDGSAPVTGGLFVSRLDFGAGAFAGNDRWLEIAVRCPPGSGSFTTLSPRQQLTATPYALHAEAAGGAADLSCSGCVGSGDLADSAVTNQKVASGIDYSKLTGAPASLPPTGAAGGSLSGTYPNPSLAADSVSSAQIQDNSVTSQDVANGAIEKADLAFSPGTVVAVTAGPGLTGGTITTDGTIAVHFGTNASTVAAGNHDHDTAYWRLGGNTGVAPGANVVGTTDNRALELKVNGAAALRLEPTSGSPNLIGGIADNIIDAGFVGVTIAGGGASGASSNYARGDYAVIGGGRSNEAWDTATVAGGQANVADKFAAAIGGGLGNSASALFTTIGGGSNNAVSGFGATVAGGVDNDATSADASVGGGLGNIASADYAAVGGGEGNSAHAKHATIGGGQDNDAGAQYATIAGGGRADPNDPATSNTVTDDYGTVGGGGGNTAGDAAGDTTDAVGATVGGGGANTASGPHSTVGGGFLNWADGDQATVCGGTVNVASGNVSTVPGGFLNSAEGAGSFAAGVNAHATHTGSFVWSDGTRSFPSVATNGFAALATGGFRFYFDPAGNYCELTSTAGWTCSAPSDRNAKDDFAAVDGRAVLARVAALPIQTWTYKTEVESIRHIGPMAQDFHAAFHVGRDEKHIATVDADGVALAAIQGLYQMVRNKDDAVTALRGQNARLEARVAGLEATMRKIAVTEAHERAAASGCATADLEPWADPAEATPQGGEEFRIDLTD